MTVHASSDHPKLSGDSPRESIDDDEFGLASIVSAVVAALTNRISGDGYVLGIQGPWGSGKSSFVNFVAEQIGRDAPNHQIIRFDPWLVGGKTALLPFLLGQLAEKIDEIERSHSSWWRLDYWLFKKLGRSLAS